MKQRISFPVTEEQKEFITAIAKKQALCCASFCRTIVLGKAEELNQEGSPE